jgi:hypothetical protein
MREPGSCFCVNADDEAGVQAMRFLLGIILGAAITVAVAYVHDKFPSNSPLAARPIVNWDVASDRWNALKTNAQRGWTRLSASLDKVAR